MDYLVPTAMDLPEATIVRSSRDAHAAEPARCEAWAGRQLGAPAPAIANAVADALAPLGIAITELRSRPTASARLRAPRGSRA